MPNTGKIVVCPFYITHNESNKRWQSTVTCEKLQNNMGFEVRNMLRFGNKDEQDAWIDLFCTARKGYMDCPYYKAVYEKYKTGG